MNNVNLLGRISTDLNLKESNNKKILNFSVAINDIKDKAVFVNITAFDKLAENIAKYQKKGNQIAINGFLQDNNYTDKDGNKRYSLGVIASRVDFISNKEVNTENDKKDTMTFNYNNDFKISDKIDDDDIPF